MEKKDLQTIQNIRKHAFDKKRTCMYPGCQDVSINSHILQRKGILDTIAENGHVIQIKVTDYYKMAKEGPVTFDRIGVGKAISLPLFCNEHDTKVFKPIESGFGISDYQSQLLYSYRAVCAEVRRKEINIDGDERIIAAKSLDTRQNGDFLEMSKLSLSGERIGFKDISMLKSDFDAELFGTSIGLFEFKYFSYGFLGVCASATFSPETKNPDLHTNPKLVQVILDRERLYPVLVHLIPQEHNLHVLLGYHKSLVHNEIKDYVSSWENLNNIQLQQKVSDLITTKVETWSMAESLYKKIPNQKKEQFKEYWKGSVSLNTNIAPYLPANFNLFD